VVAIVSIMALFVHENIKRSQIMHEVTAQADLIASLVAHDFDAIIEELHFRSEDPLAKEFFLAPATELKDKLVAELIALAKVKKIFDQIRILSVQGQEKIRIDYNNGKPIAIATEQLQDKSQRYYFPDLNKLEQGVVYVSNFDLNIENGHIETPIKPMIRFATPIYDDESGKKLGIVIFNYFGQLIINKIKASIAKKNAKLLLLNSQGSYLIGPTTDKEWGFMFAKNENFKHDFPYAWSTIASNESGYFEVESNLFSFLTIGAVSGKNTGISSQGESERWKVVLYLPTSIWSLFSIFEHLVSLVFVLVLLLIALFIAWSTALNSVYRKLAEKDKQNTLLELNFQKYALDEHAIVSITDAKGIITYVNNKFVSISGYARDELLGKTHRVLKSDEHSKAFYQQMWQTIGRGKTWHGEFKNQAKNGCFYWVQSTIVPELDKHGVPCRYISIRTDITAHQLAERELSKLFQAVESSASIVMVTDTKGIIEYINPAFKDITGYTADEVIGHKTSILQSGDTSEETYKQLWETINSGQTWRGEFRNRRKDGQYYWASATISPVLENGIVTHFTGIQQDISERKIMENELKRSQTELQANLSILTKSQQQLKEQAEVQMLLRDKAEQADRAKSEFLSSMSHELRTPLNSILGFAQIFEYKSEQALTKTQKLCVDNILSGGKHLLNLINEILDLTKIESGNMPISVQNITLYPLVNGCLNFLNSLAQEKSIQISWAENDFLSLYKDFIVSADDTRLKQVILNLLSNAIKYNHAGGQVILSSQEISSEYLRLIIRDNGPGISADKHEIIFHPFTRLEKLNSTVEGTGIGLALSKKMIELMAGKIGLESNPGSGSTFWIDIPKASVTTQDKQLIDQSKHDEASSQYQTEFVGTLLYVEDNSASLSLMEQLVEQSPGLLLLSTNSAEAGLILAKKHRPDMIILDINLPGMNGLAALAELKKMSETKNIPAVALSASAMPEDVQAGLDAGFKHYLTKPLDLNKMIAIINSSIKIRQPK